jgi:hypothetical protein
MTLRMLIRPMWADERMRNDLAAGISGRSQVTCERDRCDERVGHETGLLRLLEQARRRNAGRASICGHCTNGASISCERSSGGSALREHQPTPHLDARPAGDESVPSRPNWFPSAPAVALSSAVTRSYIQPGLIEDHAEISSSTAGPSYPGASSQLPPRRATRPWRCAARIRGIRASRRDKK